MVVRRQGQSHVVREEQLVAALCPEPGQDSEYVLAPLVVGGEVVGVVMADRAFLLDRRIGKDRLDLLLLLTGEFALMLQAIKLRREEQEAVVAKELARGISYSLRTRAAAFEARIANFAYSLGSGHEAEIKELKRAVELFFGRVGTLAAKYWRLEELLPRRTEEIDLDAVLNSLVDGLADHRITLTRAGRPTWILAERQYIDDVLREILWNACDFADRQIGRIEVGIRAEGAMARVDVKDNGPGIHPELRPDLFKPFKCFPATRMGLGLSYAARVVEAYGGSMDEIGTWKQGAHFVVRIPTVEGEEHE
jgi:C4-dicarboxylate-specific signal transduction histidine kinase